MNHSKILQALKEDVTAATDFKEAQMSKIDVWKKEYNGEPYGNEPKKKNKSKLVSRDIKKQVEWIHPSIVDPFISSDDIIKCAPITAEDMLPARQSELLLNTQFCRQFDRYNFMTKAVKVLSVEGTLVVQTGWDYKDEEIEVEVDTVVIDEYGNETVQRVKDTEIKVLENKPTAVIRRNEDVFIDPTCMDSMEDCQFIVTRYESTLSELSQDSRNKNLKEVASKMKSELSDEYSYEEENDDTSFTFSDEARKKVLVYEYWGNYDIDEDGIAEPIVCTWVNDTIIRLEGNPYPDKKIPFIVVSYNSVPFDMYGEADAEYISDNQKVKTSILRGFINNMAQSTNGQVGIKKGAVDQVNLDKLDKGGNFFFDTTPGDIWQGSYNQLPSSSFDMISLMNNEIESITGTKSFSGGITGNSLGTSATAARGVMDATSVRKLNTVRNVAENLIKPLMRKWLAYNHEFMSEQEIVRVTESEFAPIRRDDLSGRIDINIQVSTAEDNAAKAQELAFMLQTMGNTLPPDVTKMLVVEHLRLTKQPAAAKALEEFKPEPDPKEEQMKQIQLERAMLENEKLKADIQSTYASAREDETDAAYKQWKAEHEKAKTRMVNSKADREDLTFIREDSREDYKQKMEELQLKLEEDRNKEIMKLQAKFQEDRVKHGEEVEKKAIDRDVNIEQMKLQAILGSANEQIGVAK